MFNTKSVAGIALLGYVKIGEVNHGSFGIMDRAYVYILTNHRKTVLYTGSTSDLKKRIYQHRGGFVEGFTKKYHVDKLVYFETLENIEKAKNRERAIKNMPRARKEALINKINQKWDDLLEKSK